MARKRFKYFVFESFILAAMILCIHGINIKGFNFGDNMMNVRNGPDNGYLHADMPGPVPPRISFCARIYPENVRHGNQLGVLSVYTPYDRMPIFDIQCKGEGFCKGEYHGTFIPKEEDAYPRRNIIQKWSSLCIGVDFTNDTLTAYFNGEHVNKELEAERTEKGDQPMDIWLPEGYFSGSFVLFHIFLTITSMNRKE